MKTKVSEFILLHFGFKHVLKQFSVPLFPYKLGPETKLFRKISLQWTEWELFCMGLGI